MALLGGLLVASSAEQPPAPARASDVVDAPPDEPTSLDQVDAIGMAVAELVLNGVDGDAKPSKLLELDDTRSRLFVDEGRAELWNLRVHKVDDTWLTLFGCYEYEGGWQLKSLSRTPGCAP